MITITKEFHFDAAHRVLGHEGKCRFLHGHRYRALVTVALPSELDTLGRVVDFGELKALIGSWIDANWDHNLLLNGDDPQRLHLENTEDRMPYFFEHRLSYLRNPTAENIARELCEVARRILDGETTSHPKVVRVRIYETPTGYADYTP